MSLVERRTGENNLSAPTTIYGAGKVNQLSDKGASSGHSGHNYVYVWEYVLDMSKEQAGEADLFLDPSVNVFPEGAYIEQVEVVILEAPDDAATINATSEAGADVALAALAGTETAGDLAVSASAGVGAQLAADSVLTYGGAATEGKAVVRVRFLLPQE